MKASRKKAKKPIYKVITGKNLTDFVANYIKKVEDVKLSEVEWEAVNIEIELDYRNCYYESDPPSGEIENISYTKWENLE
jgi:hypothetical protein